MTLPNILAQVEQLVARDLSSAAPRDINTAFIQFGRKPLIDSASLPIRQSLIKKEKNCDSLWKRMQCAL